MMTACLTAHGVQQFDVSFDGAVCVFNEGDYICGSVDLAVSEELKVKALCAEAVGEVTVQSRGGGFRLFEGKAIPGGVSRKEHFSQQIPLVQKGGSLLGQDFSLLPGSHSFRFSLKLPPELASSFEGEHGRIEYCVKSSVKSSGKSSGKSEHVIVARKEFTVLSGLDLNFVPEAAQVIDVSLQKDIGALCCGLGSVVIEWKVPQSAFVPGESIPITGIIQNESRETVTLSRAALVMVVGYKHMKRRFYGRQQIASVEKSCVEPGGADVWDELLHVPATQATSFGRCSDIDVNYELQLTVTFNGKTAAVCSVHDVYIGTVSLCRQELQSYVAAMFNQPYRPPSYSFREAVAMPCAPTWRPDSADFFLSEERPPPYAPSHVGMIAIDAAARASDTAAKASDAAAKASDTAAKGSDTAVKGSEAAAKASVTATKSSDAAAKASAPVMSPIMNDDGAIQE